MSDTSILDPAADPAADRQEPGRCPDCGLILPDGADECPSCGRTTDRHTELLQREREDAIDMARKAVAAEAAAVSALVLADQVAATCISPYATDGCKVATVSRTGAIDDDVAGAIVHDGDGGTPVYTWFSHTYEARQLARRLHERIDVAGHVTLLAPDRWTGATPNFAEALAGAKPDLPDAIPKPRNPAAPVKRKQRAEAEDEDTFEAHSTKAAERLLLVHPDRLLVVTDDQEVLSDLYVLDDSNGIWIRGDTTLKVWLREIADEVRARAAASGMPDKALQNVIQSLRRMYEPATLNAVRESATNALRGLLDSGQLQPGDVTTCKNDKLNADLRYMGCESGVVDLHTGALLKPDQGRKALVTVMAPVKYVPSATDDDVDRLFAHLPEEAQSWWWDTLGYHMLGQPSRRVYVVEGPRNGGKSTLAEVLADVLGEAYSGVPSEDALMNLLGKTSGLSPEMEAFVSPRRWVIMDEPGAVRINKALLKKLSGDTRISWSQKYKPMRTDRVTGTVMLLCNPNTRPRLNLEDPAMEDRVRKLAYLAIPKADLDPGFKVRVKQQPFRQALFAALVAAAAKQTPGYAPPAARYVVEATAAMVVDDIGEAGMFARRIAPAPGKVLSFAEVWSEWCRYNGENTECKDPGGIGNRKLGSLLRRHVPDLPQAKQIRVQGKNVRGWRHWQLLDKPPEPEVKTDPIAPSLTPPLTDSERLLIEQVRNWDGNPDTAPPGLGLMGIFEYDPPLARCPNGCNDEFEHLNAPEDSPGVIAWRGRHPKRSTMSADEWSEALRVWREQRPADSPEMAAWREAGYPGQRQCLGCNTIFEAASQPPGGRRVASWRPETPEEAEARLIEAAKGHAERKNRHLFVDEVEATNGDVTADPSPHRKCIGCGSTDEPLIARALSNATWGPCCDRCAAE